MLLPVAALSVLATIGGLVVIPGVWEPFLHWIDETAEPLVTATVAQDYGTSAIAVSLAIVGFLIARWAFSAGRQLVTNPTAWRVLEHKLYFDEAYDALFYRPAVALSNALRRNVEEPVVERSLDELGSGTIQVGGEVARVQSGLLRTYARRRRAGRVRSRHRVRGGALRRAGDRAHRPADRGRARRRDPAAPAGDDRGARLLRRAHGGGALDRHGSALRLLRGRAPARNVAQRGSRASASPTRSASSDSRSG